MATSTWIFWLILAGIALVLALAARRPDHFRVERSIAMAATPAQAGAKIADFRQWAHWSPWENLDPTMERSYSGANNGPGAVYAWSGKGKAGVGRMEIVQCSDVRIAIRIDFSKPFKASNQVHFDLVRQGDTTQVTWAMFGPSPLVSRLMGLFFNMDALIGKDFEVGLVNLRDLLARENKA